MCAPLHYAFTLHTDTAHNLQENQTILTNKGIRSPQKAENMKRSSDCVMWTRKYLRNYFYEKTLKT
jgi:tRNA-dihydrouridine synthase